MTYSIVARDSKTWQLWVAVQTHWFWVGNNVPWLEAWVGAIATQAQTEMRYGKQGLELLKTWKTPEQVLDEIWNDDEWFQSRQVAIMDKEWNQVAHTGKNCVKYAGYLQGEDFIVQGNILANKEVLPAMKAAYEKSIDDNFAVRLLKALHAGQDAWWELRWQQSAALRIVPWEKDTYDVMNLRIDDHTEPLEQIWRQLDVSRAYSLLMQAEEEGEIGEVTRSLELFDRALSILPESKEILFWKAYMLHNRGRKEEAQDILKNDFQGEEIWKELWERIDIQDS